MGFGIWMLLATTVLYLAAGISFAWYEGRIGLGICYLAYGVANVGLIMEAMR